MPSPDVSTLPPHSTAVVVGGGGAVTARGDGEWLRVYGRVVAMLPRVEALVAGRARLEAVNALQHEFWEARDALLQHRLLQAEESRRRWEAAYIDLQPSGADRKFAALQESDFEDLTTFVDVLAAENKEFQVKVKEVDTGAEHSQSAEDHENITRDLKAELGKLKQAYEAVCSEKDKEVSQITAQKDFVQDQFKTLEPDYADLLSCRKKKATRATEAAQELQQKVEQLQVASQKKDDEMHGLQAQAKAKAAETERKLVREDKRLKVHCMSEKIDGETKVHCMPETESATSDASPVSTVEGRLNSLLDQDGGISSRKDSTYEYLRLLFVISADGDAGGTSISIRDLALILEALVQTKSEAILLDIINLNGLQMLHNILKQNRDHFLRTPIIRKLLKVLEFLALRGILTAEKIIEGPRCYAMESFRDSMLKLTQHSDKKVHAIAKKFCDKWILPYMDGPVHSYSSRRKRKSRWD